MNNQLLQRSCPICGALEATLHLQKESLQLVLCPRCEMIFANPVPADLATGAYYDHAGDYYLSDAKLQSDYAPVRFQRELRYFRRHVKSGRVLDVGCSTGAFLYQLQQRFPNQYQLLGTDVAGPALDHAEKMGLPIVRGNFIEQNFPEKFDAITFWAVLEHLLDPAAFLQKAATLLRSGGLCFILVPNFQSLATRLLGAKYRYILPQHLNYFTAKTLATLAEKYFTSIQLTTTHFNPVVIFQDFRSKKSTDQNRAQLLQRTTALKQNPLLMPLRSLYRLSEFALARLNLADNLLLIAKKI